MGRIKKTMGFKEKILDLVSDIPEGKVSTYKRIAKAVGNPDAGRAVGNVLANNPNPVEIPCHRVVKSDGKLGGYSGSAEKRDLLREEGVEIENGRINLDKFLADI